MIDLQLILLNQLAHQSHLIGQLILVSRFSHSITLFHLVYELAPLTLLSELAGQSKSVTQVFFWSARISF